MEREVQYCITEDGVRIAYCDEGQGLPLVVCPQLLESFSGHHLFPEFDRFMRSLGRGRRVVRFDFRGTGLSQREVEDVSTSGGARDIAAVADAAGLETFSLAVFTTAGPTGLQFAARHAERVTNLVLYGTYAAQSELWSRSFVESWVTLARERWDMAARMIAELSGDEFAEQAVRHTRMLQHSITAEVMSRMFVVHFDCDSTELLPLITARTAVLHREDDRAIAFSHGQKLAAGIPGARLIPLQGRVNNPSQGDWQAVIHAINSFLGDAGPDEEVSAGSLLRTVLFTDLVGHTEMMSRLGDEKGREVLREHERITREVLAAHGGTEVKTMGDGFMASFGSVTKAVECAVALQRAFGEREGEPLSVRVGLNAGEPIEEDGDLFGATVILASRIAGKAEGGEILVSDTVRGLCSGKGFLFSDRGEFVAKGFDEAVRVYEVRWRDG
jgi:class 3 adenylate cyclase/pimeloyl-ACP methyl ester carboxylesterase